MLNEIPDHELVTIEAQQSVRRTQETPASLAAMIETLSPVILMLNKLELVKVAL